MHSAPIIYFVGSCINSMLSRICTAIRHMQNIIPKEVSVFLRTDIFCVIVAHKVTENSHIYLPAILPEPERGTKTNENVPAWRTMCPLGGRYHLPGDLFPYRTPLPPTVVSFTYCSFIPLLQSQISLFNLLLDGVVEVVEEGRIVRFPFGGFYQSFALLKDGFFQWG